MTHDTSKDPRLLVAEMAMKRLRKALVQKLGIRPGLSKDETNALLKRMEGELMAAKYTYLPPPELASSEQVGVIVSSAGAIKDSIKELFDKKDANPGLRAELLWCLRTLEGLSERLTRGGETLASGVDLMAVKVRNVVKKENLWVTRVDNSERELTVVTNMPGIESGQVLGAAFLPPATFAGTVSEAMFLGSAQREEAVGTFLREGEADVKEAAGILHREVNKA